MKTAVRSMLPLEWILLLSLSVLWGGSFLFVGLAVQVLPPLTIVALRVGLAATVLLGVIRAVGLRLPKDRGAWFAFFGMGLLNNAVPFSLSVWGQIHIASGLASILNATTPFFAVILAHVLINDERLTGRRFIGVVVGFSGVVLMVGPKALAGLGEDFLAQLAVLGAALSFAFAGIFGRRFRDLGLAPLQAATGQLVASSTLILPLALMVDQPWSLPLPGLQVWMAIAGLALCSTVLAYILYFKVLATAGATNVLLVTFLIPVSAVMLCTIVLGERLEPEHFTGMGLIGLGLLTIDGRLPGYVHRVRCWGMIRRSAGSSVSPASDGHSDQEGH